MRLCFERRGRLPAMPRGPLVVAGLWAFFVIGILVVQEIYAFSLDLCFFHGITGIPCPFCGSGRGVLHLLHLEIAEGFLSNPFMMTAVLLALLVIVARLITGIVPVIRMNRLESIFAKAGIAFLFIANWGYLVFSGQVP